ncbi:hypothetical protein AB6A40_008773 [Gnathostoma spinigerum]|uniref:Chromatin modification-related protein MEAF6 n=1 Tax=Gnathostoma spinigerum TaxID=75299 RepID=A0ABD6EQ12_9BILA
MERILNRMRSVEKIMLKLDSAGIDEIQDVLTDIEGQIFLAEGDYYRNSEGVGNLVEGYYDDREHSSKGRMSRAKAEIRNEINNGQKTEIPEKLRIFSSSSMTSPRALKKLMREASRMNRKIASLGPIQTKFCYKPKTLQIVSVGSNARRHYADKTIGLCQMSSVGTAGVAKDPCVWAHCRAGNRIHKKPILFDGEPDGYPIHKGSATEPSDILLRKPYVASVFDHNLDDSASDSASDLSIISDNPAGKSDEKCVD